MNSNYQVLSYLNELSSDNTYIKTSQDDISNSLGMSKKKINSILRDLLEDGLINTSMGKGYYIVTSLGKCLINTIEKADESISRNHISFIDFFAGIGGIRKAFEDDYTQCVFSCEWDKYA